MNPCVYTCFVYLQPFCDTLDFKLFIDLNHILFLLYLLLWFWDFSIKNLQDFIKIYRALIKDIFLLVVASGCGGPTSPLVVLLFFLRVFLLSFTYLVSLRVMSCFFFFSVASSITYLFVVPCAFPL